MKRYVRIKLVDGDKKDVVLCSDINRPPEVWHKSRIDGGEDFFEFIKKKNIIADKEKYKKDIINLNDYIDYVWFDVTKSGKKHLFTKNSIIATEKIDGTIIRCFDTWSRCFNVIACYSREPQKFKIVEVIDLPDGVNPYRHELNNLKAEKAAWEKGYISWATYKFFNICNDYLPSKRFMCFASISMIALAANARFCDNSLVKVTNDMIKTMGEMACKIKSR